MKLSVIVPVYNVEAYLHRCVDSILNQTFRDFELLLVDDGSADGCPALCDAYAEVDSRVTVIHKPNGGQADARNKGLDAAQGEYIAFVDSDDCIHPQMYELLLRIAEQTQADIVQCGHDRFDDEKGFDDGPVPGMDQEQYRLLRKEEILRDFYPENCYILHSTVWDKIYRREIFRDIRFPLGVYYEDASVMLPTIAASETVAVNTAPLYHYYQRPGSTMNSKYSPKWFDGVVNNSQIAIDFFRRRGYTEQVEYALDDFLLRFCRDKLAVWHRYPDLKREFRGADRAFRRELLPILKARKICKMKKMLSLALCFHRGLALKICRTYFPEGLHAFMRDEPQP